MGISQETHSGRRKKTQTRGGLPLLERDLTQFTNLSGHLKGWDESSDSDGSIVSTIFWDCLDVHVLGPLFIFYFLFLVLYLNFDFPSGTRVGGFTGPLSIFPMQPHWANLLVLLSTFTLALLIGFMRIGGQIWLGEQILIHKFYNKTMKFFFCACFVMAFLKLFAA